MNRIAKASPSERQQLFEATAGNMGIRPAAAEKDFWIVYVLMHLFTQDSWKNRLRFKGGTSLSKAYDVIERFSEDIDLILDWNGLSNDDPIAHRSKTSQEKLNGQLNINAQTVIAHELLPDLQKTLSPLFQITLDKNDPHTINLTYPTIFAAGYLRPVIRLEIGPLAAMLPMQQCSIKSYAEKLFPQVFTQTKITVPTISIERTFWEKLTILHAESHRPQNKALPSRYARHYYDVWCLSRSTYIDTTLQDISLLDEVVKFKQRFYPASWANYELANAQYLQLMPNVAHHNALKKDYDSMKEMIFGHAPEFEQLLQDIEQLQTRIHTLS